MTYTNVELLFAMDDFIMSDSPAISPSLHSSQLLPAADSASLDHISGVITSNCILGLASTLLFPLIDDQIASNITNNDTITNDQFNILNTLQEESLLAASSRAQEYEQDSQLQSGAATTHLQPVSMVNTPDLSSVYTSSYSPSLHMLSSLDHAGFSIGWNTSLILQHYQEESLPSSYEAQQQDMVSPVSQFDLMPSPAYSYSIIEEQSVYSATPPIQSPDSFVGHDDGRLYTTTMLASNNKSVNAHGKPRFDCPECGQTFGRSQDLKRHQQSCHSNIKNFRCDCCEKAFARKDAMKRHEKSKKSNRQKRRFQRQGQSFTSKRKVEP